MKSLSFTYELFFSWITLHSVFTAGNPIPVKESALKNSSFKAVTRKVTHVIFDIDDVLLQTQHIYEMTNDMISKRFHKLYDSTIIHKTWGRSPSEAAAIIIKDMNLHLTVDQYLQMAAEIQKDLLERATVMPGVPRLCNHLRKHDIPMGLTTGGSMDMVYAQFKNHVELLELFDHLTVAEDDFNIIHGKPSPELFEVSIRKFPKRPRPENCLVFTSSPNGVIAANKAKMQVVLVYSDTYVSPEHTKLATLVIKSLVDFQPEHFALPAFSSSPKSKAFARG